MVESGLTVTFASERALVDAAGGYARRWRVLAPGPLVVALVGDLGAGKTTLVRAMLRGLGHAGRVPSPTYTLLEQYDVDGIAIVHMDLYRLAGSEEIEYLGVRDWLAEPGTWLLVEWPERAPQLIDRADLTISIEIGAGEARRIGFSPKSETGQTLIEALFDFNSSNSG